MIEFEVLGEIGKDNCVAACVATGTANHRLLLDCGGNCLHKLPRPDLYGMQAVFFSHFHFDHYAGFDELLRAVWCRPGPLLQIVGPPGTCRIIQHRLLGYLWNNAVGLPGGFRVSEFDGRQLRTIRLLTTERFEIAHEEPAVDTSGLILQHEDFSVHALLLDHGTECLGYRIQEPPKQSINVKRLEALGYRAGPWLKAVRDPLLSGSCTIDVDGVPRLLSDLRQELLITRCGSSLGYLTDFRADNPEVREQLRQLFRNVDTLICENNYRDAERDLALRNYHLTAAEVGTLAVELQPQQLVLFHVSDRYSCAELQEQLQEVRFYFPNANFPKSWQMRVSQG